MTTPQNRRSCTLPPIVRIVTIRRARRPRAMRSAAAAFGRDAMDSQSRPVDVDTPLRGRAYVFGDDLPVDGGILPLDTGGGADLGTVVMTPIDRTFPERFEPGGFVVAGKNFPTGVATEHAIRALKQAGVAVVISETMAADFFRAALNDGLPAMQLPGITSLAREGDDLEVSLRHATVRNLTTREERKGVRMPFAVAVQLQAGGTRAYVAGKWGAKSPAAPPHPRAAAESRPDSDTQGGRGMTASPSPDDRYRGAIWGQLVGDAACLGSHWMYDVAEIARLWPDGLKGMEQSPVGYKTFGRTEQGTRDHLNATAGHYHQGKRSGDQTHYGHGARLQLAAVAERGRFNEVAFGQRFVDTFMSSGYTGYKDHAMRQMLANYAAFRREHPNEAFDFQDGADDFEPSTVSRIASVVVAHRDDAAFLAVVERATRVTQNNMRAVAHAQCVALILRALFRGLPFAQALDEADAMLPVGTDMPTDVPDQLRADRRRESAELVPANASFGQACRIDGSFPVGGAFAPIWPATLITRPQRIGPMCLHTTCSAEADLWLPTSAEVYEEVRAEMRGARARASEDVVQAAASLGQGCRLNNSFTSAIQAVLRHERDFREAILNTARAGGDSAGRSSMVGAWLGASLGVEAIPLEWRDRLVARDEVARDVEQVVQRRAGGGT
ncbi:MAG: hypothetical protein EXR61_06005 [Chloroflexi bacterium]|nr:hypothetical protein [Chloroflexota bacterium]